MTKKYYLPHQPSSVKQQAFKAGSSNKLKSKTRRKTIKFSSNLKTKARYFKRFSAKAKLRSKAFAMLSVVIMVASVFAQTFITWEPTLAISIPSNAENILPEESHTYGRKLIENSDGGFVYNQGFTPGTSDYLFGGEPQFTASFSGSPEEGMQLTDPIHGVTIQFKPSFSRTSWVAGGRTTSYEKLKESALYS